MRLINADNFEMQWFSSPASIPEYAIVSHRWVDGKEITFKEYSQVDRAWLANFKHEDAETDPGLYKIHGACAEARRRGLKWVWLDTCCINKESSAELEMSIHSMFKWYQRTRICFVYLSDVSWNSPRSSPLPKLQFQQSKWFTRGWTLQELLAPKNLIFFDSRWYPLGTKNNLQEEIQNASGIIPEHLSNFRTACVAVRMSWASRRVTSLPEDLSYCLLGLFDVAIRMLYGEEGGAFRRLQEAIVQNSHDESIFAWTLPSSHSPSPGGGGILAPHPFCFRSSSSIVLRPETYRLRSYALTNHGLKFPVPLKVLGMGNWMDATFHRKYKEIPLTLHVWKDTPLGWRALTIHLRRNGAMWERIRSDEELDWSAKKVMTKGGYGNAKSIFPEIFIIAWTPGQ